MSTTRESDNSLLQYLYENYDKILENKNLENNKLSITEKMDGSQMKISFVWHDKWNKPMLTGLYSRNGTQLFKKDTTNPKDLTNLTYNKADIGTYLSKNLNNFFELIKQFKTVDQENVTFDIYTEVMLLKSPLNIPYSEDIKNKIYIFQINTTKDSYRINDKLSDKIIKLGLDPVPFVGYFDFNLDCINKLDKIMKNNIIEGFIIEFIDIKFCFKLKAGKYDSSKCATKIDIEKLKDSYIKPIIQKLIDIYKFNNIQDKSNDQKSMDQIIMKEITHSDWSEKYNNMKYKIQKENMLTSLYDMILLKYSKDDYELLNSKKFKRYFYKTVESHLSN